MALDDLRRIRELLIGALFSDDELLEQIVLKGGNALEIIHGVVQRGSLDLDFSMEEQFANTGRTGQRIRAALERHLGQHGLRIFDYSFGEKPEQRRSDLPAWWGGYRAEFKIIDDATATRLGEDLMKMRQQSLAIGNPSGSRVFKIDFSSYEFCQGKVQREVDDLVVYVYSLEMIAAEKLRAICQQMPEYLFVGPKLKRARARDFFDICMIEGEGIDMCASANVRLTKSVFGAKRVDLELLGRIHEHEDFHAPGWPGVTASVGRPLAPFREYFVYPEHGPRS